MKKIVLLLALCIAGVASADVTYFEGFEDAGWTAGTDSNNWQNYAGGDIIQVASGTDGIISADGSSHAIITNLSEQSNVYGTPTLGAVSPYTRLGGYSDSFGTGFSVSMDVYLDTNWDDGNGFDWSVAISKQDGSHLRDFIWHVGIVNEDLIVNASNNSDYSFNSYKLLNENSQDYATVSDSGWYTLESVYYDLAGSLAVDFNLLDSNGTLIYSVTRSTADDIASVVGGNRYGWLCYDNIDGLALDNVTVEYNAAAVPAPGAILLAGFGTAIVGRIRRRMN